MQDRYWFGYICWFPRWAISGFCLLRICPVLVELNRDWQCQADGGDDEEDHGR